jgi:hypothetical protein
MSRIIICKECQATTTLHGDEDPHAALDCDCCKKDHHHGEAAARTGKPCRPVTHIYIGELAAPGTGA